VSKTIDQIDFEIGSACAEKVAKDFNYHIDHKIEKGMIDLTGIAKPYIESERADAYRLATFRAQEKYDALRSQSEALAEALRPFAKESKSWPYAKDEVCLKARNIDGDMESIKINVGHLRAAQVALEKYEGAK